MIALHSRPALVNGAGELVVSPAGLATAEVLHRSGITAIDCLLPPAVPTAVAVTEAGSALANVAHHFAVAAGNSYGETTATLDAGTITPNALQAARLTIAKVTGAEHYEVFFSTAAAPLNLCRISEAQRAAGGFICSTAGVVTAGGGAGPGQFDVGALGLGVAQNAEPYITNRALIVPPAGVAAINVAGFSTMIIKTKLTVTGLGVLPTVSIRLMIQSTLNPNDWYNSSAGALAPLASAAGGTLKGITVATQPAGATAAIVLVSVLTGTGPSVDITVSLL